MGRYSRKDMIEFANFAKSYQSSRNVEEAYAAYLKGQRLVTGYRTPTCYSLFCGANQVYVDGKLVKNRYLSNEPTYGFNIHKARVKKDSWDEEKRILHLKTI
jgi:hypothetical protein